MILIDDRNAAGWRSNPANARRFCVVLLALLAVSTANAQTTAKQNGVSPRDLRSRNFLLHTDLNDDDADALLDRLERMLALISKYWGRPNRQTIEMYVVKDVRNWPQGTLDPNGRQAVASGAGFTQTATRRLGNQFSAKSIVYADAGRGTPMHEAVHAYCGQTFGATGPLWYSEGMAEMGQYWREDDPSVNCPRYVIQYIRGSQPKPLGAIVSEKKLPGDNWKNYAWRWALCHLLANNPNYHDRFRPLGLGMLTRQKNMSFGSIYGGRSKEIAFEYEFFLKHVGNGFRADLVAFDWKARFRRPRGKAMIPSKIKARGGWQPSRVQVRKGDRYRHSTTGEWQTASDTDPITADGAPNGNGKLVGIVLTNNREYGLSNEFELGTEGEWESPATGKLFLRCHQPWTEIDEGDAGVVSVRVGLVPVGR